MNKKSERFKKESAEILDLISVLDSDILIEVEKRIAEILSERTSDDVSAFAYNTLRNKFRSRFTYDQVEALRPWFALPKTKKQAFHLAWTKATRQLEIFGQPDKTLNLMLDLLVKSPVFDGRLSFTGILDSLENIPEIFDSFFPGFRTREGIPLVRRKLGNTDEARSATLDTTT